MNKTIGILTQQLHNNRSGIAELQEFNKNYEEIIERNNVDINAFKEANSELETAISMLKSRSC